jgi:glyoxylase-like metal-dependent hydrolase (beta-lactamase superfamily II)
VIRNLAAEVQQFSSNVFLIGGDRPVLVDAGTKSDVVDAVESSTVDPAALVITHTHPDHIDNAQAVCSAFGIDAWGLDPAHPAIDHRIGDEELITLGDHEYRTLHTPGHKTDHLCFYACDPGILFASDLLFENGAFGRTDLAEGDRQTLIESLDRVQLVIGESLAQLYPGHGPSVDQAPADHVAMATEAARHR